MALPRRGGRVGGRGAPPTPRAVRSAGRFGSRVRPRHIAMDTRAADAMRPAAAGGLAAVKKNRYRLPIDVDDLAMLVDILSDNGIVDCGPYQSGIDRGPVCHTHGLLLVYSHN